MTASHTIVGSDGDYYFRISPIDDLGNKTVGTCASSNKITVDTIDPANATALNFTESSPFSGTNLTANWTINETLSQISDQKILLYSNGTCTGPEDSTTSVGFSVATTSVSVSDGVTYSFEIETTDLAGNTSTSSCSSPAVTVDTTAPDPVASADWDGSAAYDTDTTLTVNWTASPSGDIANYRLEVFNDSSCSTMDGTATTVNSSTFTANHTVSADGDYYFKVIPIDTAGNENIPSGCSIATKITVDTTTPNAATSLSWDEGAVHSTYNINASWSVSSSGDVSSQVMKVYSDSSCSAQVGADNNYANNTTNTQAITVASGGFYYFQVTATDNAGHSTDSSCSSAITIAQPASANAVFETLPSFTQEGVPLSWDSATNATGYIIYRQNTGNGDISWTPTDGVSYTTSSNISSDAGAYSDSRIVYAGSALSATDKIELEHEKTYQYKIFSHNLAHIYQTGPQRLSRTYRYARVETGNKVSCATRFGKVRCWGRNQSSGVLGYSTNSSEDVGDDEHPYTMGDVNIGKDVLSVDITAASAGAQQAACALTIEGKARCWGDGSDGKLGINSTADVAPSEDVLTDVPLDTTIIQMDAGQKHLCAVLNTGAVRCWGRGDYGALGTDGTGVIGDGGTEIQDITDVAVGKTVAQVDGGRFATCVLTTDHRARCWGNNANGQLGRDNTTNIGNDASPGMAGLTDIFMGDGNPKITKIEISGASACALTENSGLRCWGNGDNGKLGSGSTSKIGNSSGNTITNMLDIDFEAPADTVDSADQVVTDFAIYYQMVCATNAAGQIKCWGNNDVGQLGLGHTTATNSGTPADYPWMDFGSKVVQFSGEHYSDSINGRSVCVVTESEEIYCWGAGDRGQLGYSQVGNVGDNELPTDMAPAAVWGPSKASPDTVRADNLQFWFDASDSSTVFSDSSCSTVANNGSAVQCWKDKSGKNNNVSSSAGEYPTYTYDGPNGMPAFDFDGNSDRLDGIVNGLSGNQEHTLFAVYKLR